MAVVLVATLDTKGQELFEVREILANAGISTIIIDAGSSGSPQISPDISRTEVFNAAGFYEFESLSRGEAVALAATGTTQIVERLSKSGQVDGILALGGSAGTTIGTLAMRALPFGVPKVMVTTLASGQTRPYVGGSDLILFPSVADVAGLNRLTRTVLWNAASAMVGMVQGRAAFLARSQEAKPVITATMFGVTTPCVTLAKSELDSLGYEVVVFHATGVGGQAMEGLVRDGLATGILDLTTTEIADEVVGGVLSAGPERLKAGARSGLPQVISLGALDMVNFGPLETVPEQFQGRLLHRHNTNVTLMRTTAQENRAIGEFIARALAEAQGTIKILIPHGGLSALDAPGQPFYDPHANMALFETLQSGLSKFSNITLSERPEHINDPTFSRFAARTLANLLKPMKSLASDMA